MLKLTRRNVLVGGGVLAAGALGIGSRARAGTGRGTKNLIIIVANGGWDTTYALDPKPGLSTVDAPAGDIEDIGGIAVFTDPMRPATRAFFEAHAGITTVINGLTVQSLVHSDCAKRVLTGTASDTAPDVGSIAAFELGRELAAPYLVLGQTSFTGPFASMAARAGTANQISTLLDPARAFPTAEADYTQRFSPDQDEADLIRAHILDRARAVQQVRGMVGINEGRYQDFIDSLARGDALRSAEFGDFNFTVDLGVQAGLALDVLGQGISRVVQMELSGFDTHTDNSQQAAFQEGLFAAITALVDELADRAGSAPGSKMLDETVVAVVSEMGRTPLLNDDMGKDHWPVTSAIVLGGGAPGGRVLGATDSDSLSMPIDLATGELTPDGAQLDYSAFAGGLLALLGVDPMNYLPGSEPFDALCA